MVGRQARAEVTRRSIITAAVELFGDGRYGDTDMTDVVRYAGIPGGTCYYYFPTKFSLAEAIVDESNTRIAAAMGSLWESEAPPLHKLINATFRFIALTENDDIIRVGYQLRRSMPQLSRMDSGGPGDTQMLFALCIKGAVADGHVRPDVDAKTASHTVFAALVGARVLADMFGDDPMTRLVAAWRTILRAIAPEDAQAALLRRVKAAALQ